MCFEMCTHGNTLNAITIAIARWLRGEWHRRIVTCSSRCFTFQWQSLWSNIIHDCAKKNEFIVIELICKKVAVFVSHTTTITLIHSLCGCNCLICMSLVMIFEANLIGIQYITKTKTKHTEFTYSEVMLRWARSYNALKTVRI